MGYIINLSNNTELITIDDGESDTTKSSIVLFGKNFAGYGELLNENQVHMLENFARNQSPANPLDGQLWWDSGNKVMKVFRKDISLWKPVGGASSSSSQPPLADTAGDLWWDTNNKQLKAYERDSMTWMVVGPAYKESEGLSGPVVKTIQDSGAVDHVVVEFYVSDQLVSILSTDPTFTTSIPNFTTIRPGFNLPTSLGTYYGNSENALSLGGVLAANFLRSDVISTTNHAFYVKTNEGLTTGLYDDITLGVENNAASLISKSNGRNMEFTVTRANASPIIGLTIDGSNGLVAVAGDPTTLMGVATKNYVDTTITSTANTLLRKDGTTKITGNLEPLTTGVNSLGASNKVFDVVYASTFSGSTISTTTGSIGTLTLGGLPVAQSSAASKQYVDNVASGLTGNISTSNQSVITLIVGNAPPSLSNLAAIAQAINNSPTYYSDVNTALNLKAPIASPSFTGNAMAPTVDTSDVSNLIATTAFVKYKIAAETSAGVSSPTFTGITTVANLVVNGGSGIQVNAGGISTLTNGTLNIGGTINRFGTIYAASVISNSFTCDGVGGVQVNAGGITTITNGTVDIGSPSNKFGSIYGTASSAQYADLAEKYVADAEYEPGTVLDFGGPYEVTISTGEEITRVAGVVSTAPAYLMNSECAGSFVASVALQGRCPVKVVGSIKKGDLLISAGNGRAKATSTPTVGTVIGKALEDFGSGEGIIEVSIGRC